MEHQARTVTANSQAEHQVRTATTSSQVERQTARPLEKLKETTYCYPYAFVEAEADYEKFYEKINSNHLHMVYGKYAKVLKMFCEIVGIEYICFNK